MTMRRITLNKIREIIRLNQQCHLSQRSIARAFSISRPVVAEYIRKINAAGINYEAAQELGDDTFMEIVLVQREFEQSAFLLRWV